MISAIGGLCPRGMCASHTDIYQDGRWERVAQESRTSGRLPAAQARHLQDAIAQHIATVEALERHESRCPSAHDGTDVTYTFRVLTPQGAVQHEVTVSNCEVDLQAANPVFDAMNQALGKIG